MKLYVAGPMRGYDQFNFPAFDKAAKMLRENGFEIVSPAEMDRDLGFDPINGGMDAFESLGGIEAALHRDFGVILECDGLAMLPGWELSSGARAEVFIAQTTGRAVYKFIEDDVSFKLIPIQHTGVELLPHHDVEPIPRTDVLNDANSTDNVYIDQETGAMKYTKQAMFSLIPPRALWQLAERYGAGTKKYPAHNWEGGYPWSLSMDALMRHLMQFWGGEDIDDETGGTHLSAVMWHAAALIEFMHTHPELDDRVKTGYMEDEDVIK